MEAYGRPAEPDGGALGQGHVRVHLHGQQELWRNREISRTWPGAPPLYTTQLSNGAPGHITAQMHEYETTGGVVPFHKSSFAVGRRRVSEMEVGYGWI